MSMPQKASWLANLPVQRKLMLAVGVILASFVLCVIAILYGLARSTEAETWSRHSNDVLAEIVGARREARDADLVLRGVIMASEPAALPEYEQNNREFHEHLDAARTLTADNPQLQIALDRTEALYDKWTAQTVRPLLELIRKVGDSGELNKDFQNVQMRYVTESKAFLSEQDVAFDSAIRQERSLLDARNAALERLRDQLRGLVLAMLVIGVLTFIVTMTLSASVIARPLSRLTGLMTRLAGRDHDFDIPHRDRGDEIGAIARSLQVFREAAIETNAQNWIKTSLSEISGTLQSAKTREEFARMLTAEVAPRVKAGVAVFYANAEDEQRLDLLGSYGLRHRKHLGTTYAPGEGLVGQVALERKAIVLEQVPADYLTIHSGIGEAAPLNVVALPLLLREHLLGVVEFGAFARFDDQQQRFLDELMPLASLALQNLTRALRTQELLERTQAQARDLRASEERMRVQQEELTATNEELHAKTEELVEQQHRLRASEEELRVQAEELQASNEELRLKTDTLNEQKRVLVGLQQETEQKAEQLAQASQYKSDFLANMSHELRTPLNSLLILSRNLADNIGGNLDAEQVESADVIHESGSNLLRLINDILDLSKIEAGKMQMVGEVCELKYFAQGLLRRFRHVAEEKGLQFDVDIAPGTPETVYTDSTRLEQITTNLLGNAFKFTRDGSVKVAISRPSSAAARSVGLDADTAVAIAVTDTGVGIPSDRLDIIFGAFEQMDASTSRKYGGSGLGLAIARRLAELLGGRIAVESQPGTGSVFTVLLPERMEIAANSVEEAVATEAAARSDRDQRLTAAASDSLPRAWIPDDRELLSAGDTAILAIEDDPLFARTLVDMIRRKGYRALAAGDGESGLYLARTYRPTGILLDVKLPGIDGWTVIDRLKRDAATRRIPVHFISAVDETAKAREHGAVGFLTKPVERDEVLTAFERLLSSSAGQTRRILLIDDDEDSRLAIARVIASDAVHIDEAVSAEQALELMDERSFDCIVLDLGLPGMSGFELLDVLHARERPLPPIVIHSARELSREESARLRQYTDSIVIKGSRSLERLLDEVVLFMHSVQPGRAPHIVRDIDSGLAGRTVLIVDDDMRNIFALSKVLREKGLSVVMAQDGPKALRQLEENASIEVVLMDIMMPGMDGYDTMREIRKQRAHAKLPIIAVTAKAMSGDRDNCLAAGANDYLAKPIDIDKLLSMLRIWLHA